MIKNYRHITRCYLLLLLVVSTLLFGDEFKVPPLTGPVVDQAGIISDEAKRKLSSALIQLKNQGGSQVAILTVDSLKGLPIEQASIKVAEAWKLGTAEKDNGVLLLISRSDKKIRLEVGQGLEGSIPDAYARRIVDEVITPLFKVGDFDGGVLAGVYKISQYTDPKINIGQWLESDHYRSAQATRQDIDLGPSSLIKGILFILLIFFLLFTRIGRMILFAMILSGGRGRGGFGGGGGGGFSGGGGGFSGGGASGGW